LDIRELGCQPGVGEERPRLQQAVLRYEHAAWQNANRALHNAHMLIEHKVMDAGFPEKRLDKGQEDRVVAAEKFVHPGNLAAGSAAAKPFSALRAL
jgi:hypothetical protein